MAGRIDWLYSRKGCQTCKKAHGYYDAEAIEVAETADSNKTKIGRDEALKLLDGVDRLIAMKGTKLVEFDLKVDRPDDDTLAAHIMGPTGNLRAPTARVGRTLIVGFSEEAYRAGLAAG